MADINKNSAIRALTQTNLNSGIRTIPSDGLNSGVKALIEGNVNFGITALTSDGKWLAISVPFNDERESGIDGTISTQSDLASRAFTNVNLELSVTGFSNTESENAIRGISHLLSVPYRLGISGFLKVLQDRGSSIDAPFTDSALLSISSPMFNTKGAAISGNVETKSSFNFTNANMHNFSAVAAHDDVSTVLRILFKYDFATGEFEGSLQLEAPEEIIKYGRIEKIIEARWVPTHRHALALGRRYLRYLSKPRWSISFDTSAKDAVCDVGDEIFVDFPISPVSGKMMVMKTDYSVNELSARIVSEYVSDIPTRIIMSDIGSLDRTVSSPGSIVYANGVATITIVDVNDVPMTGAVVTLDGRTTQISDKFGKVRFTTTKGKHVLLVENDDYVPVEIGVEF